MGLERKEKQTAMGVGSSSGRPSSLHGLFSYDNKLGGAVHAALNVCKYLAQGGYATEAVGSYAAGDDIDYLSQAYPEFVCHRVPRSSPARYFNSAALDPWLRDRVGQFDVVDLHGVFVLTTHRAAKVCRELGKPYFVRSHGSLDPFDLQKRALLKRIFGPLFVRPLLANSAGVICTTELEAERLVTYGARPKRWVVSLPVPFPEVSGAAGLRFRREFGIPEDAHVVLFLSRVDYKKGLEFLIPALAELKKKFPKLWFVLAGTGKPDYVAETRGLIDRMGIRPWTTETGFISGKTKEGAFNAANLLALPSLNENFGIVLVEAMAAGLPLLISDQVYIHKEVVAGNAGWVCETSVTSCRQQLEIALLDPEGLRSRGANAQSLAHRHFGVAAATEGLVSIYRSALMRA